MAQVIGAKSPSDFYLSVNIISFVLTGEWGLRFSVYAYREPRNTYYTSSQVNDRWRGEPADFRLSKAQPESAEVPSLRTMGPCKMSWVSLAECSLEWQLMALGLPSVSSSLMHSFIQQVFIEHLICTLHYSRWLRYRNEPKGWKILPSWGLHLKNRQIIRYVFKLHSTLDSNEYWG